MRRNALLAIACGVVLAAGSAAPTASSAGAGYHVAVSLGGDRVFEGTGTFTSATTLVVRGTGADLGSWATASGLQVRVTQTDSGNVVTYRVVDAWPSAPAHGSYSKTLTFTLSTTNP
jgi:hypothetical protein